MNLQYAFAFTHPKSTHPCGSGARNSSPDVLTRAEVLAALGITQARQPAGTCLALAKFTDDRGAVRAARRVLIQRARSVVLRRLRAPAGDGLATILQALSAFVLADYCRTPASPGARCPACNGRGQVTPRDVAGLPDGAATRDCRKCHGSGMRPLTRALLFRCVSRLSGGFSAATWSRRWNPICDELLSWCYLQEGLAERAFRQITANAPVA